MTARQQDIKNWLEVGKAKNATHLIVVCDTFDYDDYPVFVMPGEDVRKKEEECRRRDMQRVMEVYNIQKDWGPQLAEYRSFNY